MNRRELDQTEIQELLHNNVPPVPSNSSFPEASTGRAEGAPSVMIPPMRNWRAAGVTLFREVEEELDRGGTFTKTLADRLFIADGIESHVTPF